MSESDNRGEELRREAEQGRPADERVDAVGVKRTTCG
jgi:hypothetical protein